MARWLTILWVVLGYRVCRWTSGEGKLMLSDPILTATAWKSNAELIEDVARLGYLDGRVLDCTYGLGVFWNRWQPKELVTSDRVSFLDLQVRADFTNLPFSDGSFDSVVFDPPYKLNGTPTPGVDDRYGVGVPTRWQDRMELMQNGLNECVRVARKVSSCEVHGSSGIG